MGFTQLLPRLKLMLNVLYLLTVHLKGEQEEGRDEPKYSGKEKGKMGPRVDSVQREERGEEEAPLGTEKAPGLEESACQKYDGRGKIFL